MANLDIKATDESTRNRRMRTTAPLSETQALQTKRSKSPDIDKPDNETKTLKLTKAATGKPDTPLSK